MTLALLDRPDLVSPAVTIAYIDTETTSLLPAFMPGGKRVWEVGIVFRHPDGTKDELHHVVPLGNVELATAAPESLEVGGYHRRRPYGDWKTHPDAVSEPVLAAQLSRRLDGVVLAGFNPQFDADGLSAVLHRSQRPIEPWSYRLHNVGTAAATILGIAPPYSSRELAGILRVDTSVFGEPHTAMADARVHCAVDERVRELMQRAPGRDWVRDALAELQPVGETR